MSLSERRLVRWLLAAATASMALAVALGIGLFGALRREVRLSDLSAAERQRAVEEEIGHVGRVFVPAQLEPRMGYTLAPSTELEAWGGRFTSNELGFRAPDVRKSEGVIRVLFVGDSWAFGLGEDYQDSFPGQFERIGREITRSTSIESWPLALPGWNALNQAAALEVLAPILRPDLVIWCPTNNDVSSSATADPRGFLVRRDQGLGEAFGDGMFRDYSYRFPASPPYLERWRRAAAEYGRAVAWLADQGVPVAFLFVARWQPGWPEWILGEAGEAAWWTVAPDSWNDKRYRNAQSHGTPEVNRLYALAAYRLAVVHRPDWPEPPAVDDGAEKAPLPQEFRSLADDPGRASLAAPLGNADLPELYRPEDWRGTRAANPCSRTLDCETGRMGRRAALLLRRARTSRRVEVSLERVEPAPFALYPLAVKVKIPYFAAVSSAMLRLPATGPSRTSVLLDLPEQLPEGAAFEVELEAERAALDPERNTLVSSIVAAIEQRP